MIELRDVRHAYAGKTVLEVPRFTALQGEKFKFHHLGVDENRLATHSTQATR